MDNPEPFPQLRALSNSIPIAIRDRRSPVSNRYREFRRVNGRIPASTSRTREERLRSSTLALITKYHLSGCLVSRKAGRQLNSTVREENDRGKGTILFLTNSSSPSRSFASALRTEAFHANSGSNQSFVIAAGSSPMTLTDPANYPSAFPRETRTENRGRGIAVNNSRPVFLHHRRNTPLDAVFNNNIV